MKGILKLTKMIGSLLLAVILCLQGVVPATVFSVVNMPELTMLNYAIAEESADASVSSRATNDLDGSKIEGIKLSWVTQDSQYNNDGEAVSQAELDDKSHLYLAATSNSPISMVYKIEAEFSGQYDYAPGDITITIPAQVWHGRKYEAAGAEGETVGVVNPDKYIGYLELSVPAAPSKKADFNWQLIDGNYVITNTRTIGATSSVSIEVAINGLQPTQVVDMSTCDPITAHCEVLTNQGNTIQLSSLPIDAQIDTQARVTSAYKGGKLYEFAPEELSEELLANLPADTAPEDYIYVRWHTYHSHDNNQPFSLEIEDVLPDAYEYVEDENGEKTRTFVTEGIFLGSTNYTGELLTDGTVDFTAPIATHTFNTSTTIQYAQTVILWSAYRKDDFYVPNANEPERVYYLENEVDWIVTETDAATQTDEWNKPADPQKETRSTASAVVTYSPSKWIRPVGSFAVFKWTEHKPNEDWDYGYALNQLESNKPVDMNFHLATVGHGYPWTTIHTKDFTYGDLSSPTKIPYLDENALEESYGKLGWTQITHDYQTFFNFEDTPLTSEDFQFKSLRVTVPQRSDYVQDFGWGWAYTPNNSLPVPDLRIEYQLNGEDTWYPAATAMWGEDGLGEFQFVDVSPECTTSGKTVFFPDNVTDVRHIFTSNVFGGVMAEDSPIACIDWDTYTTITLKPSERVRTIVRELFNMNENPSTKFKNDVTMDVYGWVSEDDPGTLVFFDDFDSSRATLSGASYGVTLGKTYTCTNDPANQQLRIKYTATLTEQSNLKVREEYDSAVAEGIIPAETSGTWYDLLPPKVVPLTDTVKLRAGDTIRNVYTIDNYKNTGRILLVVEADLAPQPVYNGDGYADKPVLTFEAVYSWVDMDEYGTQLVNYIAFETNIEELRGDSLGTLKYQQGHPDNPAGDYNATTPAMPNEIRQALTGLNPNTKPGENRFVYGKCDHGVVAITYAVSGLDKAVSNDLVGIWTQGLDGQEQVTVYEGHNYSYRLRISSAENTSTKGIIIYDTIENYIIPDPTADEDTDATKAQDFEHTQQRKDWNGDWQGKGQWRGTLRKVDLSEFVNAGVSPVLYYSLLPGLQFADSKSGSTDDNFEEDTELFSSGNYDISNRDIWQVAELDENGIWTVPEGINVSAVAIDATTTADGSEFVLKPEESMSAYLRMAAPDDNGDPYVWNAKGAYARTDDGQVDWEAAMNPENNMYAFNNARVRLVQGRVTTTGVNWLSSYRMIRNDYTRVGIIPGVLKLEKVWKDQNNHDGLRPESVTVGLYRKVAGTSGEARPVEDSAGKPITVTMGVENSWRAELYQMDLVDENGTRYLYSFVEEPVDGYTYRVEFLDTNHYRIINEHPNEQIPIEGQKIWGDEDDAHGQRPESITLTLYRNDVPIATQTVTAGTDGSWSYSFGKMDKYADGGTPYAYRVEEEYVPKYINEADGYVLVNNTYYPLGDLEVVKTVENATPAAQDKTFTFTLVLLQEQTDPDAPAMPLMEEYPYAIFEKNGDMWSRIAEGQIGNGDTFQLKDGQKLRVENLPSESTYRITESEVAGFTITSKDAEGTIRAGHTARADFTNIYAASGSTQLGVNKNLRGRQIRKNQFRFELVDNNENSPTYGEVLRTARVDTPDADATTGGAGEEILSESDAIFGQLKYTEADVGKTFQYIVREVNIGADGFSYDAAQYDVTVTVTDETGDGNLTVTHNFMEETISFENSYSASGEVALKAWKTLEGRELVDGEFTFELYPYDPVTGTVTGACISTVTNDADGNIVFDVLTFDQDDVSINPDEPATYHYMMQEKLGSDRTVDYSSQVYFVELKVYDNGDGTLSFVQDQKNGVRLDTVCPDCGAASQTNAMPESFGENAVPCDTCGGSGKVEGPLSVVGDTAMPVFENKLRPGNLNVTKKVEGDGSSDPNQEFNFHVKFTGEVPGELDYSFDANMTPTPEPTPTPDPGKGLTGGYITPRPANTPKPITEPDAPLTPNTPQPFTAPNTPAPRTPSEPVAATPYKASNLSGDALAILNQSTGKMVFFRATARRSGSYYYYTYSGSASNNVSVQARFSGTYSDTSNTVTVNGTKYIMYRKLENETYPSTDQYDSWPWYYEQTKIKSVSMEGDVRPISTANMFKGLSKCNTFDLSRMDTSRVTDMSRMFYNCTYVNYITNRFDFSNVTSTREMFYGCQQLWTIDLSSADTSKLTDMSGMFFGCKQSRIVGLSSLNTSNVTNMSSLFSNCKAPAQEDISRLDTSNVTDMSNMFYYCVGLTELDVSTFDTSNVTTMAGMFYGCSGLTELDLSTFDTSKVTSMSNMFYACRGLTELDVSNFDTGNVTDMSHMFRECSGLTELDLSTFDTRSVTKMNSMFFNCSGLTELDLSNFDTGNVTDMSYMFYGCSGLTELDVSTFDTGNVTDMSYMFKGCSGLTELDVSTFDTSNAKNTSGLFEGCSGLTELDVSTFDTSKVTNMSNMFKGCSGLTELDVSTFDTSKVSDMSSMFYGCSGLTELDVSTFDTSKVSRMSYFFKDCSGLTELDLSTFNTSAVTTMEGMFSGCSGLQTLDLRNFDTSKVMYISSMFYNCSGLKSVNVSSFNVGQCRSLASMFFGCSSLTSLDISQFRSYNQTYNYMFKNCTNLQYLDMRSLYMSYTANTDMFRNSKKLSTVVIGNNVRVSANFPYSPVTNGYNGEWYNVDNPDEVLSCYKLFYDKNHAGTWSWKKAYVKLNFDPGEGAGSMPSVQMPYKMEYSFVSSFYRRGYKLTGFTDGTNTYSLTNGMFTIPANNKYKSGEEVTLTAVWSTRGEYATLKDNGYSFKLKADQSITFENVPAAVGYEVWEETPAGWVLIRKVDDTGIIQPLETGKAVFTNEYNPEKATASLRATKLMDGTAAEEGAFTFTLSENGSVLQTKKNAAGGGISFDLIEYGREDVGVHTYTIAETAGNDSTINYDGNSYTVTVTVADDGKGVLTASVEYENGEAPVFENTTKPGNLTICKITRGATTAAADQTFTVQVRFTDDKTQPWSGVVTANGTEYTVTDGLLTATMGDGGTLELEGIPAGIHYCVSEPELLPGWSMDADKNGVIESAETKTETLVNVYSVKGVAAPEVNKILVGRTLTEDEFTFQLYDLNDQNHPVVATVFNAADGTVIFPDISFAEEGTYYYGIMEIPGNDETVEYSREQIYVRITMTDKDGKGLLIPEIDYSLTGPDGSSSVGVNDITNRVKPGKLTVSKQVISENPAHAAQEFTFTLLLTDEQGQPITGQYFIEKNGNTEYLNVSSGNGTFTLMGGETALISGLPHGANYAVVETAENGFMQTSTGATGSIVVNQTASAAFTNTYAAEGQYTPTAFKTLAGKELEADEFTFALLDADGYELLTATNDEQGNVIFAPLSFTHADVGTRTYQLVEKDSGMGGITYDTTVQTLTLTIVDNGDGTLSITDDLNGQPVQFNNNFDIHTSHTVNKVWMDEEDALGLRPGNISVELYQNRVKYREAVLTADNGWSYTFTELPAFDEQGTKYLYEVREVPVPGYTTVMNTQGNVTTLTNMSLGVLEVTKTVTIGNPEKPFPFTVTLMLDSQPVTGSFAASGPESVNEVQFGEDGTCTFRLKHGETMRITGLPIGAAYVVTEETGEGYVGELTEGSAEGSILRNSSNLVGFTNSAKTTTFQVTKVWEGGSGAITLTLYANGEKMDPQPNYTRNGDVYTYENLRKYDNEGLTIEYSAKEKYFDGFVTIYENVAPYENVTNVVHNGGTIINRAIREADFQVFKRWRGLDENETPPAITLTLYCNGEKLDVKTPHPNNGWYKYYDLPDHYKGAPAVYTVVEEPLPGYEISYEDAFGNKADSAGNGGTIINTRIPTTGDGEPLTLWMTLGVVSLLALLVVVLGKRRKK